MRNEFDHVINTLAELALYAGAPVLAGTILLLLLERGRLKDPDVRNQAATLIVLFVAVAVLGAAAGLAAGRSRVSVVGDIYPAAFALLGGASAYLFGINRDRAIIVAMTTTVFAIAMFSGLHGAAAIRHQDDEQTALREVCLKAMTNADLVKDKESYQAFRNAMIARRTETLADFAERVGYTPGNPKTDDLPVEAALDLCAATVNLWGINWRNFNWTLPAGGK